MSDCGWNITVGGINYPLASKRAELHIFAGLINNCSKLNSHRVFVNIETHSFECFG